jgi:hypothetical protein
MAAGIRKHLSYANVTATLALVVAIGGGTAFALRGKGTVTSYKIRNGNVTGVDLSSTKIVTKAFSVPDTKASDDEWGGGGTAVFCPRGFRLIGGGGAAPPGSSGRAAISRSSPNGDGGWTVTAQQDSGKTQHGYAFALCIRKRPGRPRLLH